MKPQRKRESEWRAFLELEDDYEAQDIADCLSTLQERSRRDSGGGSSAFHSPMAYLAKAMSDVLAEVLLARKQSSERAEREQRQAEAERKLQAEQAREADDWALRERAFYKAFPDESRQLAVISELCTGLPWKPTSQAGKAFAIDHWWLRLMASERDLLLA